MIARRWLRWLSYRGVGPGLFEQICGALVHRCFTGLFVFGERRLAVLVVRCFRTLATKGAMAAP